MFQEVTCISLARTPAVTDGTLALFPGRDGALQLRSIGATGAGDTEGSLCSPVETNRGGTVNIEPGAQLSVNQSNLNFPRITQSHYIMHIFGQILFSKNVVIVRLIYVGLYLYILGLKMCQLLRFWFHKKLKWL